MQRLGRISRSPDARRERRQFITHNVVAALGAWGAGVFGLLLQAIVSHHFRPAEYGQAFAVFSFFTILTQPAYGFSRLIAWSVSRERASGSRDDRASSSLLRITYRRLFVASSLIALALIVGASPTAGYLHVPPSFVIFAALGVPFTIAAAPLLATLQGEERWVSWSVFNTLIALSRVVCVIIFVIPFGVAGVLLGISVAAVILYLSLLVIVWPRLRRGRLPSAWRPHWRFLVLSLASAITVAVGLGSDVVMVQHFFGARVGGQFSAVAVTTRTLFFALGSIPSVLFPKVAARHATSRGTRSIVAASVAIAVVGGVAGLLVFSTGSHLILGAFSGRAYEGGSSYIGWYALGMPLLAAVVMLSNTQQSLSDLGMLWVLIPGTLLKPLLVFFFHQSLLIVSLMSDISIGALLLALSVRFLMWERRRERMVVPQSDPTEPLDVQTLTAAEAAGIAQ